MYRTALLKVIEKPKQAMLNKDGSGYTSSDGEEKSEIQNGDSGLSDNNQDGKSSLDGFQRHN